MSLLGCVHLQRIQSWFRQPCSACAEGGATPSPAKEEGVIKIKIKLNIMPFVRSPGLHLVIWVSNSVKLAAERSLRFRKSCAKREGADWLKYVKVVNF